MALFERIVWQKEDRALLQGVRKLQGQDWSTAHLEVKNLRARLLELQNHRCVYCQAIIESDENGHREIDHILPKKASKNCTTKNGSSNDPLKRRSTLGYSEFTFEPKNFAICCKQCNTFKGSYDPLLDRKQKRPIAIYPTKSRFVWMHPQYHLYSKSIILDKNFVFSAAHARGASVIAECKLDKSAVLEKKFFARARAHVSQHKVLHEAIEYLVLSVKTKVFGISQAIAALEHHFELDSNEAEAIFKRFGQAKNAADRESVIRACKVIQERLRRKRRSPIKASKAAKATAKP